VNYEDTYIFRRFYALSAKPTMYRNMNVILSNFISIAEVFLMYSIDYTKISKEASQYITEFRQYMETDTTLETSVTSILRNRFSYYENAKEWFD
jgi:hypothetical protein